MAVEQADIQGLRHLEIVIPELVFRLVFEILEIVVDVQLFQFETELAQFIPDYHRCGRLIGAGRARDYDHSHFVFPVEDLSGHFFDVVDESFFRSLDEGPDILAVAAVYPVVESENTLALVRDVPFQSFPADVVVDAVIGELLFRNLALSYLALPLAEYHERFGDLRFAYVFHGFFDRIHQVVPARKELFVGELRFRKMGHFLLKKPDDLVLDILRYERKEYRVIFFLYILFFDLFSDNLDEFILLLFDTAQTYIVPELLKNNDRDPFCHESVIQPAESLFGLEAGKHLEEFIHQVVRVVEPVVGLLPDYLRVPYGPSLRYPPV